MKKNLKLGLNYNNAFTKSLEENINLFEKKLQEDVLNILKKPNNILAIQYLKCIMNDEHPRTCIVTTHRPTVLTMCDRVYAIRDKQCKILDEAEIDSLINDF